MILMKETRQEASKILLASHKHGITDLCSICSPGLPHLVLSCRLGLSSMT